MAQSMINTPIRSALRSALLFHTAALVLTSVYWWSGFTKIINFSGAQAEMAHFGLEPAALFAVLTIATQLIGSALIISGSRLAWLGAGALAAFTLATIPLAHRFWEMEGIVAFLEKALVQEHITVIGGLFLAAFAAEVRRDAD
jgi:transmembrane protein